MTARRGTTSDARPSRWGSRDGRTAAFAAALIIALACLTTLQWTYNSSPHVYTTDVGEIQNALPRWGTLHFTGYPVYSILGSAFVSLLRVVGVGPALGSSLYSALWSVAAAALVAALAVRLGARRAPEPTRTPATPPRRHAPRQRGARDTPQQTRQTHRWHRVRLCVRSRRWWTHTLARGPAKRKHCGWRACTLTFTGSSRPL